MGTALRSAIIKMILKIAPEVNLVSSLPIRNAVLKSWIEESQAQEGVNTLSDLVCQARNKVLQIKHVQASKAEGLSTIPSAFKSQISIYFSNRSKWGSSDCIS
jgi:hypothetical protein